MFSQKKPVLMENTSLEPHGLLSPKAHLCAYGYTILKNALKIKRRRAVRGERVEP
jgi:hypothetical protein